MEAEEAKKEIREMVAYIINVDDKDVIESYAATFDDIMESYAAQKCWEREKYVVTEFQDFLLKNGYCDTDVYAEPPTAIDQFFSNK